MMMRMLAAGGMEVVTDNIRQADTHNPYGYYEVEQAKKLPEDASFLGHAHGKAIKIVSPLLYHLPTDKTYKIIFMKRHIEEILASQKTMLEKLNTQAYSDNNDHMRGTFKHHLDEVLLWIDRQGNMDVIYIHYNDVIDDPYGNSQRVNQFLGNGLDVQRMADAVDKTLYREKAARG